LSTEKPLKGQEIVSNREEIIAKLNQALAAEGLASYLFLFYSKAVSGRGAHETSEILTGMAASEQAHMAEVMERIVQLGGEPLTSPSQWEKSSYAKYAPPKINFSPRDAVEACIRIEEQAIAFYQELAHQTQHTDYVTFQLISKLLADEVADEHQLAHSQ
jgi:bacterioferritin